MASNTGTIRKRAGFKIVSEASPTNGEADRPEDLVIQGRSNAGAGSGSQISHHILSASGTMVGICTAMVGLVKVTEGRVGPSVVDDLSALASSVFLTSAILSYLSLRLAARMAQRAGSKSPPISCS